MKSLAFMHRNDARGAVGDFSPVLSIFSHYEFGNTISPFLLLDHIGPGQLLPSSRRQGVNEHPHRGFETVTIVYAGEIEHRDSTGGGGIIQSGDVQWMTAAGGIVHRELFSEAFTQRGGRFEMVQLWVNLPAADKMGPAGYQNLTRATIPVVDLPDASGTAGGAAANPARGAVRVIAGEFNGIAGAARTHTRMSVLDVTLPAGQAATFNTEAGDTALVFLRSGRLQFTADTAQDGVLEEEGLAVMSSREAGFAVTAQEDSKFLVLTGEPLNEPINGHGPFVMNSYEEILQAYDDVKQGRLSRGATASS